MIARRLVRVFLTCLLLFALPTPLRTAAQETSVSTAETVELQQQVEKLWQQVELRFATEPYKRQQWRGVLAEALVAWNGSNRGAAEYEQMSAWFAEALEASMPGGAKDPPAAPVLAAGPNAEPVVTPPTLVEETLPAAVEEEPPVTATTEPAQVESAFEPVVEPIVTSPEPAEVKLSDLAMAPAAAPLTWPAETESTEPAVVEAVEASPPVEAVAAEPADEGNPFVDDPLPAEPTTYRAARPVNESSVRVDLRELAVNVRGYNSAVQAIRGELVSEKNLDAAFFARLVRETIQLRSRRSFLELYLNNLSASDLETIPELQAVETLAEEIRTQLEERIDSNELAGSWEHDVLVEIRSDLDSAGSTGP